MCNLPFSPPWIVDPAGAKKYTVYKCKFLSVDELMKIGGLCFAGS